MSGLKGHASCPGGGGCTQLPLLGGAVSAPSGGSLLTALTLIVSPPPPPLLGPSRPSLLAPSISLPSLPPQSCLPPRSASLAPHSTFTPLLTLPCHSPRPEEVRQSGDARWLIGVLIAEMFISHPHSIHKVGRRFGSHGAARPGDGSPHPASTTPLCGDGIGNLVVATSHRRECDQCFPCSQTGRAGRCGGTRLRWVLQKKLNLPWPRQWRGRFFLGISSSPAVGRNSKQGRLFIVYSNLGS